ncbi:hypothetical protein BB560_005120, partial [Smittium megazygosporum]
RCPFCNKNTPETIEHMLIECFRWNSIRHETTIFNIPRLYRTVTIDQSTNNQALSQGRNIMVGKLLGGESKETRSLLSQSRDRYSPYMKELETGRFMNGIRVVRTLILDRIKCSPSHLNLCNTPDVYEPNAANLFVYIKLSMGANQFESSLSFFSLSCMQRNTAHTDIIEIDSDNSGASDLDGYSKKDVVMIEETPEKKKSRDRSFSKVRNESIQINQHDFKETLVYVGGIKGSVILLVNTNKELDESPFIYLPVILCLESSSVDIFIKDFQSNSIFGRLDSSTKDVIYPLLSDNSIETAAAISIQPTASITPIIISCYSTKSLFLSIYGSINKHPGFSSALSPLRVSKKCDREQNIVYHNNSQISQSVFSNADDTESSFDKKLFKYMHYEDILGDFAIKNKTYKILNSLPCNTGTVIGPKASKKIFGSVIDDYNKNQLKKTFFKPRSESRQKYRTDFGHPSAVLTSSALSGLDQHDGMRDMLDNPFNQPSNSFDTTDKRGISNPLLERIKLSFISLNDLPEANPSDVVLTELHRHQKQALFFMITRETKGIDVFDGNTYDKPSIQGFDIPKTWLLERSLLNSESSLKYYRNAIIDIKKVGLPSSTLGGIIADDMGLGKTLSMISLIVTKKPCYELGTSVSSETESYQCSPINLVNNKGKVPSNSSSFTKQSHPSYLDFVDSDIFDLQEAENIFSVVKNWEEQIKHHTKEGSLKICVYHGELRKKLAPNLFKYDVVISTYSVLQVEYSKEISQFSSSTEGIYQLPKSPYFSPLQSYFWDRVVLDEAHIIRERKTLQSRAASSLKATFRWFKFLRFSPLDSWNIWNNHVSSLFVGQNNKSSKYKLIDENHNGAQVVQMIFQTLSLRRIKNQLDPKTGARFLKLPPITEKIRALTFSKEEQMLYDYLDKEINIKLDLYIKEGTALKNYMSILSYILRLRQLCVHPMLVDKSYTNFLGLLDSNGAPRGSKKCESFGTNQPEKQFQTFDKPKQVSQNSRQYNEIYIDSSSDDDLILVENSFGNKNCTSTQELQVDRDQLTINDSVIVDSESYPGELQPKKFCFHNTKDSQKVDPLLNNTDTDGSFAFPKSSKETQPKLSGDTNFSSTKMKALIEDLLKLQQNTKPHISQCSTNEDDQIFITPKSVVFSQWTSALDILEKELNSVGLKFSRLDGSMKRQVREEAIEVFSNDPSCNVMLISLKAGGVGLNLTAANNVFLLDPYWNPSVERQAIDRVHRIGQKTPVFVYRYIINNSIEEKMDLLKKKKDSIANASLMDSKRALNNASSSKGVSKNEIIDLTVDDLSCLDENVLAEGQGHISDEQFVTLNNKVEKLAFMLSRN